MKAALAVSRAIDRATWPIGRSVSWLILAAVLVSAANATSRKLFSISSNAYLELQWYLFGAAFLLAAAYTLQRNEHIRIDIISNLLPKTVRNWIDIFGHVLMLLPFTILIIWEAMAWFCAVLPDRRDVEQLRRPDRRGRQRPDHRRLRPAARHRRCRRSSSASPCMRGDIAIPTIRPRRTSATRRRSASSARIGTRERPMTAFIVANMAPLMFASLVVFLLLGYPVAFALAFNGLAWGIVGIEFGLFQPTFFQALPDRIYGVMSNETLLAIPFFTFMGLILERSGMAEDLLDTIGQLFGPVRGGLALAVVVVGALLAATTGVVAASVIAMGLISLPIMLRYGYDRRLATGVIAASGTLAQIIPPSLVLIVMADQLGRSVGDMYQGAIVPGIVLSALYLGYVMLVTALFPEVGAGPAEGVPHDCTACSSRSASSSR